MFKLSVKVSRNRSMISRVMAWLTVPIVISAALLVHRLAAEGMDLLIGLPVWVLVFIALQIGFTMAAAWIARP